jgi:hypothetical protein
VIIDHEYERVQHGITPSGRAFQSGIVADMSLWDVGVYADPSFQPSDSPLWAGTNGKLFAYASYVSNHQGSAIANDGGTLFFRNLILDNVGSVANPSVLIDSGSEFQNWSGMGGAIDEIRNSPGTGIELNISSRLGRADAQLFYFKNVVGPCLKISSKSELVVVSSGFKDGGGNLDVGIEVEGPKALVELNTGTDVTGSVGDVRMADGGILTYAEITSDGPFTDEGFNLVSRS